MRFLLSGINDQEYFLLVTGKYGMGKTVLYLQLTRHLEAVGKNFIQFPYPPSYQTILQRLIRVYSGASHDESVEEGLSQAILLNYIQEQGSEVNGCVIVLDEAQDIQLSTLNKLRLLSNFNLNGIYPFQIVLFSHPSISRLLSRPVLEPLNQRIRRRYQLKPLSLHETREYIFFRLLKAGATGSPVFQDDAIQLIHQKSAGIPRFINNICDGCLLLGDANNLDMIDAEVTSEAIYALGIDGSLTSPSTDEVPVADETERGHAGTGIQPTDNRQAGSEEQASRLFIGHPDDDVPNSPDETQEQGFDYKNIVKLTTIGLAVIGVLFIFFWVGFLSFLFLNEQSGTDSTTGAEPEPASQDNTTATESTPSPSPDSDAIAAPDAPSAPGAAVSQSSRVPDADNIYRGSIHNLASVLVNGHDTATDEDDAANIAGKNNLAATTFRPDKQLIPASQSHSVSPGAPIEPPDQSETVDSAPESGYRYSLIAALCSTQPEAKQVQDDLEALDQEYLYLTPVLHKDEVMWWAVYQGYYQTGEAARQAKQKLGLTEAIIAETPFAVQVKYAEINAASSAKALEKAGYTPYLPDDRTNTGAWLVGAYNSRDAAGEIRERLNRQGFDATVVRR